MTISINNAVEATNIFIIIFVVALFLSLRRKKASEIFSVSLTHELKGLAILSIIFSHIGYFLITDHRFLFPLSIMAGVGVNMFLFLSGYGLAVSTAKKDVSFGRFYRSRLLKLFVPFWIALVTFFAADFFILDRDYAWGYIAQSFLGYFPRADLVADVNAPLWYFTLSLFYYILFPLVYSKRHPWLSSLAIYVISYLIIVPDRPVLSDVMRLYQVHILAFPIGVFIGGMFSPPSRVRVFLSDRFKSLVLRFQKWHLGNWFREYGVSSERYRWIFGVVMQVGEAVLSVALLAVAAYTAYYSGVDAGPDVEQLISLVTVAAILLFFLIKRVDINLFHIYGFYSYEIYLLHWPILARYDIFLRYLPAWLAVVLYLTLFLSLGWLLKKLSRRILRM